MYVLTDGCLVDAMSSTNMCYTTYVQEVTAYLCAVIAVLSLTLVTLTWRVYVEPVCNHYPVLFLRLSFLSISLAAGVCSLVGYLKFQNSDHVLPALSLLAYVSAVFGNYFV